MHSEPRNILVILLAGLTHTTLALPALKALRRHFKDSRITIVSSSSACELLLLAGCADSILPAGRLRHGELINPRNFFTTTKTWSELRQSRYDLVIDLKKSAESGFLARMAPQMTQSRISGRAETGIGQIIERLSQALGPADSLTRHAAHKYLRMLEPLGVRPVESEPRMITNPESDQKIEKLLKKKGLGVGDLLVGIHPCSGPLRQRWSFERYASVAARLIHNYNARLLVFSGPMEKGSAKRLVKRLPAKSAIAIESPGIADFVSAAARLSLFIGNHSGPAHVAAAAGSPVVAISVSSGPSMTDLLGRHTEHLRGLHPDLISEEAVYEAACRMLKINRAEFLSGR
ncbi:MAG: glycosyltransferase family 9 protein [Acidobacteria bacterium]|nr:glycosyltransferase family 9 protein [Acidobacteriota bacterium]